jgi:hypothetical protein
MNEVTEVLGQTFRGLAAVFMFAHIFGSWRERIRQSGHRKTMQRIAKMQGSPFRNLPLDPR